MRSIRGSAVGRCLFLRALGWGQTSKKEKNCKSPGGAMVTGQIQPCIRCGKPVEFQIELHEKTLISQTLRG